ncbi:bifunctional hydroxymethylpyrimidine kinase/phosphomethylpyrimidine kinase [Candidatus Palauibacter sp.]|uniref:bifunctional hydroxymethylpyrimidine kinase/phosphomethylpyrimidine kinase n=1 Tax=Candidatus Palauibacter sp. TaxID=3101350 RepID=UPI003AF205F5
MPNTKGTTTRRTMALTIAGSDSGGGAGIQADLKTFHSFGVFGLSAVTAVTAQNTVGVQAVQALDPPIVRRQIDSVRSDLPPSAAKTGMLANAGIVRAVVGGLRGFTQPLVVDPVMVATSGDRLLDPAAVDAILNELLPLATLVTPNLPEAAILAGRSVGNPGEMSEAARAIVARGAGAALVKGGHLGGDEVVDLLWDGERERVWRSPRIRTSETHGTGCTLSAAITAGLASGLALEPAIEKGLAFTHAAIASAPGLGSGRGPVDHWAAPESADGS